MSDFGEGGMHGMIQRRHTASRRPNTRPALRHLNDRLQPIAPQAEIRSVPSKAVHRACLASEAKSTPVTAADALCGAIACRASERGSMSSACVCASACVLVCSHTHSSINSLNVFINEVVVTRTFKDFDQLQIRSPLFSQVLKRPRFRSWRRRRVWTV